MLRNRTSLARGREAGGGGQYSITGYRVHKGVTRCRVQGTGL